MATDQQKSLGVNNLNLSDLKDRCIFYCSEDYDADDRLAQLLLSALHELCPNTQFAICDCGDEGVMYKDGDILIFPEMRLYRGLQESTFGKFVEEVLVKEERCTVASSTESLTGVHAFLYGDGKGEVLDKFAAEIAVKGIENRVSVSRALRKPPVPDTCLGVLMVVFVADQDGAVTVRMYESITSEEVPLLVTQHFAEPPSDHRPRVGNQEGNVLATNCEGKPSVTDSVDLLIAEEAVVKAKSQDLPEVHQKVSLVLNQKGERLLPRNIFEDAPIPAAAAGVDEVGSLRPRFDLPRIPGLYEATVEIEAEKDELSFCKGWMKSGACVRVTAGARVGELGVIRAYHGSIASVSFGVAEEEIREVDMVPATPRVGARAMVVRGAHRASIGIVERITGNTGLLDMVEGASKNFKVEFPLNYFAAVDLGDVG